MFERLVLAFYYAWYGAPWGTGILHEWFGWSGSGYDPERTVAGRRITRVTFYPLDGLYDSSSDYTVRRHLYQARQAGLDGFIVSWWGFPDWAPGKHVLSSDATLRRLLELAPEGFRVTVYYETAERGGGDISDNIVEDLARIYREYCRSPRWLRVDGKPVVFIYGRVMSQVKHASADDVEAWRGIRRRLEGMGYGFFMVGDSLNVSYADCMDGLHTYNPIGFTTRGVDILPLYRRVSEDLRRRGKLFAATVVPGYDDMHVRRRTLEPRRDGGFYLEMWDKALASNPDWILVTSWNEWYEGTQIEPSLEHGLDYLQLTKQQAERFKRISSG